MYVGWPRGSERPGPPGLSVLAHRGDTVSTVATTSCFPYPGSQQDNPCWPVHRGENATLPLGMRACTHVHTRVCTRVHTCTCIHICTLTNTRAHMLTCIHIHIFIYIDTHIYTIRSMTISHTDVPNCSSISSLNNDMGHLKQIA